VTRRTFQLPEFVQNKVRLAGAEAWLRDLPGLIADLEREWSIVVGETLHGGSEAFVAEATMADGTPAVLKVLVPRSEDVALYEMTALRLANGEGCARLYRADEARGAMLIERLGRMLFDLNLPLERRLEIMCDTASRVWRPAHDAGFPTGAEKGRWLIDFINRMWDETGRPCSERAVAYGIACAERRIAAHDDDRAVLVHGDVHQWNTLEAAIGGPAHVGAPLQAHAFKLIDPDGLLAEPEYDLGVLLREDPVELMQGDAMERARWLADRTGLNATSIWEWGAAERVSTGLLCYAMEIEPAGSDMLKAGEYVAATPPT
jgi:streptomycin 6-kinase